MPSGELVIIVSGALAALAGGAILCWALLADRVRTRKLRRTGALRRCPRCWYDMAGVAGRTCPECGRTVRRERSLARARLRPRAVAGAALALALGGVAIAYPSSRDGAWKRWLPDTAVILLVPHTTEDGWAIAELSRRLESEERAARADAPGRLAPWQWNLLHLSCADALARSPVAKHDRLLWNLVALQSPEPERMFDTMLRCLDSADQQRVWQASIQLSRVRFRLSAEHLARASTALQRHVTDRGCRANGIRSRVESLDRQLVSRMDLPLQRRLAGIRASEITPELVIDVAEGGTIDELQALYYRLGLPRSDGLVGEEWEDRGVSASRSDLLIDDDDAPDCAITLRKPEGYNETDVLVLLRRGDGWRCAGRLLLTYRNNKPPPELTSLTAGRRRWLLATRTESSDRGGMRLQRTDAWCRVRAGRLELHQVVCSDFHSVYSFDRRLESGTPTLVERGGRHYAAYELTSTVGLPLAPGERSAPLGQVQGVFEFPLAPERARFGEPAPGRAVCPADPAWIRPWPERDLIPILEDQLAALLRTGDTEVRDAVMRLIDRNRTFPQAAGLARLAGGG